MVPVECSQLNCTETSQRGWRGGCSGYQLANASQSCPLLRKVCKKESCGNLLYLAIRPIFSLARLMWSKLWCFVCSNIIMCLSSDPLTKAFRECTHIAHHQQYFEYNKNDWSVVAEGNLPGSVYKETIKRKDVRREHFCMGLKSTSCIRSSADVKVSSHLARKMGREKMREGRKER